MCEGLSGRNHRTDTYGIKFGNRSTLVIPDRFSSMLEKIAFKEDSRIPFDVSTEVDVLLGGPRLPLQPSK